MRLAAKNSPRVNILAIAVVVAVVASVFFASQALGEKPESAVAVVHDSGGGITRIALDGSEDGQRTITTSLGSNTLVVEEGHVHVSEASCPNHDCIKQGAIDATNEQIVCLPNKLWIEVVSDETTDADDSYDTIGR